MFDIRQRKKYSENVSRPEMGKQTTQDRRTKKGNLKFVSTVFPRLIDVPGLIASIIAPRPPSTHTLLAFFSFFLSPPCRVKVESDPAKVISDKSSSDARVVDIDICDRLFYWDNRKQNI